MRTELKAALIGAVAGILGGVTAASIEGQFNIFGLLEERRTQIELENVKLQSNLILRAIDTDDPEKSIRNLEFLSKVRLIPNFKEGVDEFLAEEGAADRVPALRELLSPYRMEEELSTLDTVRYRVGLESTGLLTTSFTHCSASLVGSDIVVTTDFCVNPEEPTFLWEFRLGYFSNENLGDAYAVEEIIRLDKNQNLAVLRLQSSPPDSVERLAREGRAPVRDEEVFLVHYPQGESLRISDADCRIKDPQVENSPLMTYVCRTDPGSSGGVIFGKWDSKPLGMHIGIVDPSDGTKNAIRWDVLSELIQDIQ